MSSSGRVALQLFGLTYGLLSFGLLGARAIVEGYITKKPRAEFWRAVEKGTSRTEHWTLSKRPDGFFHALHTLRNGRILHYVTACKNENAKQSSSLVIFLHGWPDSWMLWSVAMKQSMANSKDTHFIALDLPGYGGSDALDKHDTTQVLEAVTEFILAMRSRFLDDGKDVKVVIVAHDWGALVGFKLASQASELADRFILINSALPELALENITRRWNFLTEMLPKWMRSPSRLSLLRSVRTTISPVATQLSKSSYAFIFNLPKPLPIVFGTLGELWFIRFAHFLASGGVNAQDSIEAVNHMASTLGPNDVSCQSATTDGSQGYGLTVTERATTGAWSNSIRYYSEGLTTQPWNKSIETLAALHNLHGTSRRSSGGAGIFEEKKGQLKVPVTILWGEQDPALSSTIMLEGMRDYFVQGSQIVALPKLAHWVPLEKGGSEAVVRMIAWALDGEKGSVEERLKGLETDYKVTVTK